MADVLVGAGTKQSLFAAQSAQYADLYSSTLINLINYPLFCTVPCYGALLPCLVIDAENEQCLA